MAPWLINFPVVLQFDLNLITIEFRNPQDGHSNKSVRGMSVSMEASFVKVIKESVIDETYSSENLPVSSAKRGTLFVQPACR